MPDEHGGARAEGCDARRLLLKERQVKACMRAMGWGGIQVRLGPWENRGGAFGLRTKVLL
jgi:hypothetical protein